MKKLSRSKGFKITPNGQWEFPGENTLIPSNQITMKGVPYPVFGMDDTGYSQMMYPGMEYTYPGSMVYEIPMAQDGKQKGVPDFNKLYNEYKAIQSQINQYIGNNEGGKKEQEYRLKLNDLANKLVEEGVSIENTDYVPQHIKQDSNSHYCIGSSCYILNQAGENFKYFSNSNFQDDVIAGKVPGRTFDYSAKGVVPGDIIQFKRSQKGSPYHAYLIQDISAPDKDGNRKVIAVGSAGSGPMQNKEYTLTKDNKITSEYDGVYDVQTIRRERFDKNPVPNDLLKKRDEIKSQLDKYYPNYKKQNNLEKFTEVNDDPNVIYNYTPGTAFEWNKKNRITRGNPYSPTGRTINLEDSKISEILNVFSNPDYKQQFMAAQNVSPEEYDAIVKNVIGIYGQETKFGTREEALGLSKFLPGLYKSVGPFQINPDNLKTKRFSRDDLFDPIKGAEAAATFLAENIQMLRNRANAKPEDDIYSKNLRKDNYLEYLSLLMNDRDALAGDKKRIELGLPILEGKSSYKRNVDQYIQDLGVEAIPISIAAPEFQSGGTFNPDTDEFIGFVDELPQAQTGKQVRKPKSIYADISTLTGKNRYNAYKDSLDLYTYDQLHKQLEPSFSTAQLMALNFGFNTSSDYANNQRKLLQAAQEIIKRNPRIKYGSPGSMFNATYNDYHLGNGIGNSPDLMMKDNSIIPDGIWLGGAGNDDWSNVKPKQQVIPFFGNKPKPSIPKPTTSTSTTRTITTTTNSKPKITTNNYSNTKKELIEPTSQPRPELSELEYLQPKTFTLPTQQEEPLKLNKSNTKYKEPYKPSKVLLREMGNINRYRNSIDGVIKEPYKNSHEVYMDDNKGWRKVSPDEYEMLKQQYPGADTEKGWIKNSKKSKGGLIKAQEGKENKLRRRNQSKEDDVLLGPTLQSFEVEEVRFPGEGLPLASGRTEPTMGPIEAMLFAPAASSMLSSIVPRVGSNLMTGLGRSLPGMSTVPGATYGNLLGAYGATDAMVNRIPYIPGQLSRGEYGDALANTLMSGLDISGANMISPLSKGAGQLVREQIYNAVDPFGYGVREKILNAPATWARNTFNPSARPKRIGSNFPTYYGQTVEELGKNRLDAWRLGLNLNQKYNTFQPIGNNTYKIKRMNPNPDLFNDLYTDILSNEIKKGGYYFGDDALINVSKRNFLRKIQNANYPNDITSHYKHLANYNQPWKQVRIVEKSKNPNFTNSIYDADTQAIMGNYRWDVKKLDNGNIHFQSNDTWDINPWEKRGSINLDNTVPSPGYRKWNPLSDLEFLNLVGGKKFNIQNNFEVDPKTYKIIDSYKKGGTYNPNTDEFLGFID